MMALEITEPLKNTVCLDVVHCSYQQRPSFNKTLVVNGFKPYSWHCTLFYCCIAVERLIKDNCQIDGDDLINYMDFVQSIKQLYEDGAP